MAGGNEEPESQGAGGEAPRMTPSPDNLLETERPKGVSVWLAESAAPGRGNWQSKGSVVRGVSALARLWRSGGACERNTLSHSIGTGMGGLENHCPAFVSRVEMT